MIQLTQWFKEQIAGVLKLAGTSALVLTFFSSVTPEWASAKKPQTIGLDLQKSTLRWEGRKPAGSHHGTVKLKQGFLKMEGGKPVGGEFIVDLTTISNQDLESEEDRQQLESHLKSKDFFHVSEHPQASFKIEEITPVGASGLVQKYRLKGPLTIRGITHTVTLPGKLTVKDQKYVLTGSFSIDRTRWGVKYKSKKFFDLGKLKDKFIYDTIEFDVDLITQ